MHWNILTISIAMASTLAVAIPIPVSYYESESPRGSGLYRVATIEEAARKARTLVKYQRFANISFNNEAIIHEKYATCDQDSSLTFLLNKEVESFFNPNSVSPTVVTIKKQPFFYQRQRKEQKTSEKEHEHPKEKKKFFGKKCHRSHERFGFDSSLSLNGQFVQVNNVDQIEKLTKCFNEKFRHFKVHGDQIFIKFEVKNVHFKYRHRMFTFDDNIPVDTFNAAEALNFHHLPGGRFQPSKNVDNKNYFHWRGSESNHRLSRSKFDNKGFKEINQYRPFKFFDNEHNYGSFHKAHKSHSDYHNYRGKSHGKCKQEKAFHNEKHYLWKIISHCISVYFFGFFQMLISFYRACFF